MRNKEESMNRLAEMLVECLDFAADNDLQMSCFFSAEDRIPGPNGELLSAVSMDSCCVADPGTNPNSVHLHYPLAYLHTLFEGETAAHPENMVKFSMMLNNAIKVSKTIRGEGDVAGSGEVSGDCRECPTKGCPGNPNNPNTN